ncbi:hypothetical protein EON73_02200 [bacterium]|nr:MAG: hypothetical protein EON73_02200 [bacterium]
MKELISCNFGNWTNILDNICRNCGGASIQQKVTLENTRNVIIFSLMIADVSYNNVCDFALSVVSQTELMFGNKKYVLSGATFHHGNNFHMGHYTSIVRKNNEFYRTNDGTVTKESWPRNSKDLYLLFYIEK